MKEPMKLKWLIIFFLSASLLWSITLEEGKLKLVVDDYNGGFLLYSRDSQDESWRPLLNENNTASYFSVLSNGEWVNLVLDSSVTRRVSSDQLSVTLQFDHPRFSYVVKMELITLGSSARQNYLSLKGTLYSKSTSPVDMGVRFLMDSQYVLQKEHFYINGESIISEKSYSGSNMPTYLLNRGTQSRERIYLLPGNTGILPTSLVLANWYRLDQSRDAAFITRLGRSFDALPYSINDAAAAYYWDAGKLSTSVNSKISVLIGVDEPESKAQIQDYTNLDASSRMLRMAMVQSNLEYIEEFLNELTYIEQSGQNLSENDILILQRKLETLKSKKSEYEDLQ